MATPVPTPCPACCRFPAPMALPTNTVTPMVRPVSTIVSRFSSWLPEATPDCSLIPANRPTMIRSAAPYMACRNRASRTGSAKPSREGRIFPRTRLFVFVRLMPTLPFMQEKKPDKRTGISPVILSGSRLHGCLPSDEQLDCSKSLSNCQWIPALTDPLPGNSRQTPRMGLTVQGSPVL